MEHKTTQDLFGYWMRIRADRAVPLRRDIDPGDIRRVLPHLFILERQDRWTYKFRLAGTALCELYGTELRGHNMLALWRADSHTTMARLLDDVIGNIAVGDVRFTVETDENRQLDLEMLLLPLAQDSGVINRVLGAAVPVEDAHWMGDRSVTRQWIRRAKVKDPGSVPVPEPAEPSLIGAGEPPATVAALSSLRPKLEGERPYLRLVKPEALGADGRR